MSLMHCLIAVLAACAVLALIALRLLPQRPLHWFGFSLDGEALVEELTMHLPQATPDGGERVEHAEQRETVPSLMDWWRRQG